MNYWEDKKVLVTGAHGFVGQNLMTELSDRGACYTLSPTKDVVDLTNEEQVSDYFFENSPDVVIHLAGKVGGIKINSELSAEFFYKNIMMGVLVTHHAYLNGAHRMVSLAAGCGYPKFTSVPFSEEDFWMGLPDENSIGYSMAKKNLIIQSWVYREQYGFNSTVLLPANLYGPHDNFDLDTSHVVPALIRKFLFAKANNLEYVEVWGTGIASREFLYVKDTVKAILDVAEDYNESGPLNLGTGVETTIKELVETIKHIIGYDGQIRWLTQMSDGQPRRSYNMSKFEEAMGYVPDTSLREGLMETIKWYVEN